MNDFNWRITPEEFLNEVGAIYKVRGNWLQFRSCIFCDGAVSGDPFSLNVHKTDGNFFCHRARSCGSRGSFWKLIEVFGLDPRDYLGERTFKPRKKKRGYIYGQK